MSMTGAKILIEALKREGVDTIFGYQGGKVIPIFNVLHDTPEINVIIVRHEQAAVHAAEGYAKSTGKPGVVLVTSGPGATNTITGLADANFDSVPIICLCGQVATFMIGIDAFQEADMTGISNPVTKHNYLVHDVKDLAETVKNSFYIANTGRPGPVLIDLPVDVLKTKHEFNYDFEPDIRGYKPHTKGNNRQIQRAAEHIKKAKKPLIIVGGGAVISDASKEINSLIEKCDIPATSTLNGLGIIKYDSPYNLGMHGMHGTIGANHSIQESDLLIALGSRFDDRATGKLTDFAPNAKIIHVDIDAASISKDIEVQVPVVGDLKQCLIKLLEIVKPKKHNEWMKRVKELQNESHDIPENSGRITAYEVINSINQTVPEDSIMVTDVGQHQMWVALYYKWQNSRSQITSGGLGTMGFGFPAAVGCQIANPDKKTILVSGDGSFQMNIQELATAVIEGLPLVIIIMNNGYLGMVRQWQDLFFDKRYASTCLMKCDKHPSECNGQQPECRKFIPDFVKVAEAYGAKGIRVTEKNKLNDAINEALKSKNTPYIIDVITEREENVYPMVPGGSSLHQLLKGDK